ncbi:MAG: NTP transferase domain-containing protein, partial [Lentisphaerae bacterium]|nr:NTP transferase domain-containing protein [Lentisphaerota bacterium]
MTIIDKKVRQMKVIILAAGLGTRLRPITENKPKCMVNVSGKPILQHQIEAYLAAGVDHVAVVAGYKGEQVEYFCSKYDKVCVIQNAEYSSTNNMYSLGLALRQDDYKGGFILSNGDVVYDPEIVSSFVNSPDSAIAVDKGAYSIESMKVIVERDCVIDISKQIPFSEAYGNSIDLYKFTKETASKFIETVEQSLAGNANEWTEVALQRAVKTRSIRMLPFDISGLNWVEVDNYDDLAEADFKFSDWKTILKDAEAWFVDLDGTLYLGDGNIDGAGEFIEMLRRKFSFCLYSNNSSKNKTQYVEKLKHHGIIV